MTALLVLDVLIILGWAIFCVGMGYVIRTMPRAQATPSAASGAARVSVIIPAHNEEALLPKCLDSVRAQLRPVDELIVVDDESRDATARRAIERGARVIQAGTRPEGWGGKPWAAHVGANAASGDWLLFVDADAVLAPNCVGTGLAEAETHGADLLSFVPAWRCSTLLESLVQPIFFLVLYSMFDNRKLNDPSDPTATSWGGFLLFRRSSYEKLGGHTTVKNTVYEDLEIAQEVKRRGMKLRVLPAPELAETARPLTARRIWDDSCRAAFGVAQGNFLRPLLSAEALFVAFVGPYVLAPFGRVFLALAIAHYVLTLLVRFQFARGLGFDFRLAALQPIGTLYLVVVMLWASLATLTGRAVIRRGTRQYKG